MSTAAGDRRPIASRNRPIFQAMAVWLIARRARPNAISIAGMLAALAAGACLAATPHVQPLPARLLFAAAAGLIQLRLLSNMLDGMVAVGSGRASPLGELYNEIPDRVSDAAALIGLGYAAGGSPELGYAAATLAVFCAYVRAIGKAAGAGSDFRGPMAKQQRMFAVTVAAAYLALAPASWRPRAIFNETWGLPAAALLIIAIGTAVTCARRLAGVAARLRHSPASMP